MIWSLIHGPAEVSQCKSLNSAFPEFQRLLNGAERFVKQITQANAGTGIDPHLFMCCIFSICPYVCKLLDTALL